MTTLFLILVILAAVILGLIVLVQNPKGGGLAGNIAGFSNQFMGVKQTTDILEKGTWLFAGIIAILCLLSSLFMSNSKSTVPDKMNDVGTVPVASPKTPANTIPLQPATGTVPDTTRK